MAKQTFTTGQVLTAAQMTSLQQTAMGGGAATAKTASYVLVAADAGSTVIMNSASATTITVNSALFAAGDTVLIVNQGAGVCTVTAGTATVTTAGSLTLTQYETGILYFLNSSSAIFSDYTQSGAMTNPMTNTGDTIYSSSGSTPARLGIGTTGQVLTVASGIPAWATASSTPTFVGVRLASSTAVTLPNNTNFRVPYDLETYDTSNFHSNTVNNTRITIPAGKAGYYFLYTSMCVNTGVAGEIRFAINGTTMNRNDTYGTGSLPVSYQASSIISLAVGDYIEIDMYQNSGAARTLIDFTFLAQYLGA